MRYLMALASIVTAILCAPRSDAQGVNGGMSLEPNQSAGISQGPGQEYDYACIEITVPANTLASVTLGRISGSGDSDIHLVDKCYAGGSHRARVGRVYTSNTDGDQYPNVLLIEPSGSDRQMTIYITDEVISPSRYRVYFNTTNIAEGMVSAAAEAGLQMIGEQIVCALTRSDCSSGGNENIGRALNLGFSIMTQENIMQVGVDVVANEIANTLGQQFPNNRFVVSAVTIFFKNALKDLYSGAFDTMTRR